MFPASFKSDKQFGCLFRALSVALAEQRSQTSIDADRRKSKNMSQPHPARDRKSCHGCKKLHAHLCFLPFARTHGHTNLGLSHTPFPRAQHHLAWCTAAPVAGRRRLLWVTCQKRSRERTYPNQPLSHNSLQVSSYFHWTFGHKCSFVLDLFVT